MNLARRAVWALPLAQADELRVFWQIKGIINPGPGGYVDRVIGEAERAMPRPSSFYMDNAGGLSGRHARHQPAHPGVASPSHRLRRSDGARAGRQVDISYAAHLVAWRRQPTSVRRPRWRWTPTGGSQMSPK